MQSQGLDKFLELKDKKIPQVFIFLLGKTDSLWLDEESCWVHHLRAPCHVVRLTEDEFRTLDIGIYPKTIVTKAGAEVESYNGVPPITVLKKCLSRLS